jgi:hypothetical protein
MNSVINDMPFGPQKKRGRPSLLSEAEKLVLGGFAHHCNRDHTSVGLEKLRTFIWESFGENASDSIISRTMKDLGFRSHRTGTYHAFFNQQKKEDAKQLVVDVRDWVMGNIGGTSRCVFEDEMTQWDSVFALRSYSPVGRSVFGFSFLGLVARFDVFCVHSAEPPKSNPTPELKRSCFILA